MELETLVLFIPVSQSRDRLTRLLQDSAPLHLGAFVTQSFWSPSKIAFFMSGTFPCGIPGPSSVPLLLGTYWEERAPSSGSTDLYFQLLRRQRLEDNVN